MKHFYSVLLCCAAGLPLAARDLSRASIDSGAHAVAADLLRGEIRRRTGITLRDGASSTTIRLSVVHRGAADGYRIETTASGASIAGNDARGLLFGAGRLLRELRMQPGSLTLPDGFTISTAPRLPLRGHQLGYRPKPNSYDGWTAEMWEQYFRDLVVFGTNAVELIPPVSDDSAASPHFPAAQLPMMIEMSRIAAKYGLEVWIWYPALERNYADPATVQRSLEAWGQVVSQLPRVDAIFVPGGDPGRTRPSVLLPFLERQAAHLKRHHPKAGMWVSPQSFSQEWMDEFLGLLEAEPGWLSGVVYGPEIRMPIAELRRRVPRRYPIRSYPDITHTTHAQFVQPDWDLAFSLTHNREPINPRPLDMRAIFRHELPSMWGFLTYSEGCNDDLNKILWSALGWDPEADITQVLREYSRYFIGAKYEESFTLGLLALERNWRGAPATNGQIATTLAQFQSLEHSGDPKLLLNWRFQMALYRAYYDAYIRRRLIRETEAEQSALDAVRNAGRDGSLVALDQAARRLDVPPPAADLRSRVFELAEALFQSIRMQLSVDRYQAEARERGATLDNLDTPLNNAPWLRARFREIRALGNERERLAAISRIVNWTNPGPGGFYDDLGDPANSPHLVRPAAYGEDPGHFRNPLTGYARRYWLLREPWRMSMLSNAESMFDAPVELRYSGLDPTAQYRVRVIYGGEESAQRVVRLVANRSLEVHPYRKIASLTEPVEIEIPREATASGELTLTWTKPAGLAGAGRGCQIAEVWLIRLPIHMR